MRKLFSAAILAGLALMAAGLLQARAQVEPRDLPNPATPEEAARLFMSSLANASFRENTSLSELIAKRDWHELGPDSAARLMVQMNDFAEKKRWKTAVSKRDSQSAVVDVSPVSVREQVVCIRENGGWRVDMVETWRRWNKFTEAQVKQKILADLGVELPGVLIEKGQERIVCRDRMRHLGLALMMYRQDYDEKMPVATRWATDIQPYAVSERKFNCPSVAGGKYGYAFNADLSEQDVSSEPWKVGVLYETENLRLNAWGLGLDADFRHEGGAHFILADGHCVWRRSTTQLITSGLAAPN